MARRKLVVYATVIKFCCPVFGVGKIFHLNLRGTYTMSEKLVESVCPSVYVLSICSILLSAR